MKQVYEISLLYDFYGELLTEGQREILSMYYFEDLSLSEISETRGATRAAAHDLIKRSESKLHGYEEKLHLIERFQKQSDQFAAVLKMVEEAKDRAQEPEAVRSILTQVMAQTQELIDSAI